MSGRLQLSHSSQRLSLLPFSIGQERAISSPKGLKALLRRDGGEDQ